jgi:hypothetical protein
METMKEFVFLPRFLSLAVIKDINIGNRILNELVEDKASCLGTRQIGDRSYHIFYFKNDRFAVYYHKGGTDDLYSSKSLDEALAYVNNLKSEDFQ